MVNINNGVFLFQACLLALTSMSTACMCPGNYDPFCGPDGKTYGNKCGAICELGKEANDGYAGECKDGGGDDDGDDGDDGYDDDDDDITTVATTTKADQETCNEAADPSLCQHLDARRSCSHVLVKQVCPVKCDSCLDVTPEPPAVQKCFEQCVDDGFADCVKTKTLMEGSNQQFHCDHACLIRDAGASEDECIELCNRRGNSGCNPTFKDLQFRLCVSCDSKDEGNGGAGKIESCKAGCKHFNEVTSTTISTTTTSLTTATETSTTTTTTVTSKTATTKTTTITTTSATGTTTTIFDPGNVDCIETQDACTTACEAAGKRNYNVVTPTNAKGKTCVGATDCMPGDDKCPTTSTTKTTSTTTTTTTTQTTKTATTDTGTTTTTITDTTTTTATETSTTTMMDKAGYLKLDSNAIEAIGKTVDDMISAEVGFTPMELSQAGFSASEIAEAAADSKQFTPADLKPVPGMTAAKLERSGFSANDVRAAGYSPDQMAVAGYSTSEIEASKAFAPAETSATTIVIVVAVALVLVIVIAAVIVAKNRRVVGDGAAPPSFENPMYDSYDGGGQQQHDQHNPAYMDPQGAAMSSSTGYMDVSPQQSGGGGGAQASGYMDVAPRAADGFAESDEEEV